MSDAVADRDAENPMQTGNPLDTGYPRGTNAKGVMAVRGTTGTAGGSGGGSGSVGAGDVERSDTGAAAGQEPDEFAVQIGDQIESFILSVREVAKGDDPDSAVPYLLLEVSQLLLAGGRLGAHEDFVPDERYEPDAGPEPDEDELRQRLAELLEPIDVYSEVFDPYVPRSVPVACRISDDLAEVVADLAHGLTHFRAGRVSEALWWWQFSYLSNWGPTASASLRALQSLVAHVRLDSPLDELDGLDTGSDGADDEQLAVEAGRVMEAELGRIGMRRGRAARS